MKILILLLFLVPFAALAQQIPTVISLWEKGAPGFENRRNEPEQAKDWWVKNIHNPSITVYLPPKEKANGTAVIVCPGGGHNQLVITAEGKDAAEYLNSIGVTAFVLKYRLAREPNSPYKLETHVREDAHRAIRLVRSRAAEWGIDTSRVGMLGFSAGGETVALVAYVSGKGDPAASDAIDRLSGKPNFQMLIYPGPLYIPGNVPSDAPPAFALVANEDPCCAGPVVDLLRKYREAKVPIEVHIYAKGNHGFNMGKRTPLSTLQTWPQRMTDWMMDAGYLENKKK